MKQHTVVLADDHGLVRGGLRALIDQMGNFTVIAEASTIADAIDMIGRREPDILLSDITMGDDNGLDLTRMVRARHPAVRIVMLSMHSSDALVKEAVLRGAFGFLLKEDAPAEMRIALESVMRGEQYMSPALSLHPRQAVPAPAGTAEANALSVLTPRQIQILTMIARRKAIKEIAFELDLSEKTIGAHRSQIMERLGMRDVVGLALFAAKHGLV